MSSFLECKKNKVFHDKTYKYIIRRRRRRKFSISSNIRRIKYISQYIIRRRRKFSRIYKNRDEEFNIELDPFPDSFDLAESHDSLSLSLSSSSNVCAQERRLRFLRRLSLSLSRKGGEEIREETVHGERLQNGCRQAEWAYVMEASRLAVYIVALRA